MGFGDYPRAGCESTGFWADVFGHLRKTSAILIHDLRIPRRRNVNRMKLVSCPDQGIPSPATPLIIPRSIHRLKLTVRAEVERNQGLTTLTAALRRRNSQTSLYYSL